MDELNQNIGLIMLILALVLIVLMAVCLFFQLDLRSKIATQRLKFLGFYSAQLDSRERYAEIVIGNRSLNDLGITELGIKNGKMTFDLTALYRRKAGLKEDARIAIEQRSSLQLRLTVEELSKALIEGKNGKKILKTLKVYAVDVTGALYEGKVKALKSLLEDAIRAEKEGVALPASAPVHPPVSPAELLAEEAPVQDEPAVEQEKSHEYENV